MENDPQMEVDDAEDRRFNELGRVNAKPTYTLECGYTREVVVDPWPAWVQRNSDGTLTLDLNDYQWNDYWSQTAFPGVDFSKHRTFPFPWNNSYISAGLTKPAFINRLRNIVAALPTIPFFIFTPPLWLMLNAVGVGKQRFHTHNQSPIAISSKIIFAYLQVIHVLEGSTHIYTPTQIERINTIHMTDVKDLTDKLYTRISEDREFMALADKARGNTSTITNENGMQLTNFTRYIVTFTRHYILLLERKILRLSGKSPNPDDLPKNFFIEVAVPDPQNSRFTPFFEAATTSILVELSMIMNLKYDIAQVPMPANSEFNPANSIHGIAVKALKLLLVLLYPKSD